MRNNVNVSDLVLDNYEEDFYNENVLDESDYKNFNQIDDDYNISYVNNYSDENDYDNFSKVQDVDDNSSNDNEISLDEESSKKYYTYDDNVSLFKYLSIFSTVFKWLGIAIAVVLIAYFITQGNIKSLLLYILGLIISFFFGYFFMFLINKYTN